MLSLILAVAFAILVATFAVQNRNFVDVRFGTYLLTGVPVYLLVLLSILSTLLFAGILFLANNVSSFFTIHGKEHSIKERSHENEKLVQRVHDLEVENAKLKEQPVANPQRRPYFFPVGRRAT